MWKCINDRLTKPQWQKVLEHFGISNPKASPISARDVVQCLQIPNIGEGVSKCLQEVCGQSISKYQFTNLNDEYISLICNSTTCTDVYLQLEIQFHNMKNINSIHISVL